VVLLFVRGECPSPRSLVCYDRCWLVGFSGAGEEMGKRKKSIFKEE